MAVELTFEKLYKVPHNIWAQRAQHGWWAAEILKSQLATQFTIDNGIRADFWEIV